LSLPHSLCWVTLRELLQETLDEEQATDEALTEIAKSTINQQAEAAE
jgi:ferritin-like metal-binding protein YciE